MADVTIIFVTLTCVLVCMVTSQSVVNVTLSTTEEFGPGRMVGSVLHSAHLDTKYNNTVLPRLRFKFLSSTSVDGSYFTLRENTGFVLLAKQIDRDTICPKRATCTLRFDIVVQPPEYFQVIKVSVQVLDTNDNRPTFPVKITHKTVAETFGQGYRITLPVATDPDSPAYGLSGYKLNSFTDTFKLVWKRGKEQPDELFLELKKNLDYEKQKSYMVRIVAFDNGRPSLSGTMDVNITVTDVNDNKPEFVQTSYEVRVNESAPVNYTIVQVHARDIDAGLNGQVVYKFSPETLTSYGHLFSLNSTTGVVVLLQQLDFGRGDNYHLIIQANDRGLESLQSQTKVVVHVQDLNNHAPVATVSAFSKSGKVEVSENAKPGTFVAHIAVKDKDGGRNGEVNCTLIRQNYFSLKRIYGNEWQLVTRSDLDYEAKTNYSLVLRCWDSGVPAQVTTDNIIVSVLDENDHKPIFAQQEYSMSIEEDCRLGTSLITVAATDKDSGLNGYIRYSLAGGYNKMLSIDSQGTIRTTSTLDREQHEELNVIVIAQDSGSPRLNASAIVKITLIDANDEPPEFSNRSFSFNISENQPLNTVIGYVNATDDDSARYNTFYFGLSHNEDSLLPFTIDPENGKIMALKSLDREERQSYSFEVIARDAHDFALSDHAKVTITVLDQNDNAPELHFPSPYNNIICIPSDVPTGKSVVNLTATDKDQGPNSNLSYHLLSKDGEGLFSLNPVTGEIVVNSTLSGHSDEVLSLAIVVLDSGDPQLSSIGNLNIIVNKSASELSRLHLRTYSHMNMAIIASICLITFISTVVLLVAIIYYKRKYYHKTPQRHAQPKPAQYAQAAVTVPTQPLSVRVDYIVEDPLAKSRNMQPDYHHLGNLPQHRHNHQGHHPNNWADLETNPAYRITGNHGDRDSETASSNADSGRGASEEGESPEHSRSLVETDHHISAFPGSSVTQTTHEPSIRPKFHRKNSVHFKLPPDEIGSSTDLVNTYQNDFITDNKHRNRSYSCVPNMKDNNNYPNNLSINAPLPAIDSHIPPIPPKRPPRRPVSCDVTRTRRLSTDSASDDGGSTTSGSYTVDLSDSEFNSDTFSGVVV